jgi:hypothetical protein
MAGICPGPVRIRLAIRRRKGSRAVVSLESSRASQRNGFATSQSTIGTGASRSSRCPLAPRGPSRSPWRACGGELVLVSRCEPELGLSAVAGDTLGDRPTRPLLGGRVWRFRGAFRVRESQPPIFVGRWLSWPKKQNSPEGDALPGLTREDYTITAGSSMRAAPRFVTIGQHPGRRSAGALQTHPPVRVEPIERRLPQP